MSALDPSDINWTFYPARSFETFAPVWDELNESANHTPLLDSMFLKPLLAQFSTDHDHIGIAVVDGMPIAAILMRQQSYWSWQSLQPPQAPLGLLVRRPDVTNNTLCVSLLYALPGYCQIFSLMQQDPLLAPRPQDGPRLQTLDYIETPGVPVWDSVEDMHAGITRNLASNLKRKKVKLTKAGLQFRFELITDPGQIADAVDDFGLLESAGWKGRAGSAVHPDNAQGVAYREIFRAFAAIGEAQICRLWIGDELAASDLRLRRGDTAYSLKTTYNEDFRDYSPTQLMREQLIGQHYIGHGVRRIEYYGQVKDWHRGLKSEIRQMYHVNYYRWPMVAVLHARRRARNYESEAAADD